MNSALIHFYILFMCAWPATPASRVLFVILPYSKSPTLRNREIETETLILASILPPIRGSQLEVIGASATTTAHHQTKGYLWYPPPP